VCSKVYGTLISVSRGQTLGLQGGTRSSSVSRGQKLGLQGGTRSISVSRGQTLGLQGALVYLGDNFGSARWYNVH
jgi:hypothetical protein